MADKDKPGTTATTESLVDFSKLPADALDKYIDHYGLAQRYPPYPPKPQKKKKNKRSASDDSRGGKGGEGDDDDDDDGDLDSEERASKRIDSNQPITTSTRLRPRSPTASMSHFFPGGGGGAAAAAAGGRRGTLGGAFDDDLDGDAAEASGKDWEIPCPSHFFDAQEADNYLATVAGRHFAAQPPPKEGEVVVQFLYRCRTGDKCLKVAT